MIKGIKYFLITSVALGFLQMDTSAMRMKRDDEDSNNNNLVTKLKSEGSNPIENKKAECPEENDQNNKIASILLENMRDLIQENGKIRELQQTTLSRMQQQSEEINSLQAKIDPLLKENETLSRKVGELQEQLNPSKYLKATLVSYNKSEWRPYTTPGSYVPITFEKFVGEDKRMKGENDSFIRIPEDGLYSLYAHYCCHATNAGPTAPYTCIMINTPSDGSNLNYFVHHHLAPGYEASDGLNRIIRLKKDDRVMLSVWGSPNAEYYLANFQLEVEKIH